MICTASPVTVASHNPPFLPWAGWWHKALSADRLIYALGTKLENEGYDNRVKLGDALLTVPLVHSTRHGPFKDCRFDKAALPRLAKSVRNAFGRKCPFQERALLVAESIELYSGSDFLADFNVHMLTVVARLMAARDKVHAVFDLVVADPAMTKTERLIARIRRHVSGPVVYRLGRGALDYIDADLTAKEGITLTVQELSTEVENQTALQLVATERDPYGKIMSLGKWGPLS
jgi:hypothetical protein